MRSSRRRRGSSTSGPGMGRIGAALAARGHDVVATEPDPALREQSRATYADLPVLPHEALAIPPLEPFDLIVVVGNVFIYLGEDTERDVLAHLRSLLAPGGRILAGFHLQRHQDRQPDLSGRRVRRGRDSGGSRGRLAVRQL